MSVSSQGIEMQAPPVVAEVPPEESPAQVRRGTAPSAVASSAAGSRLSVISPFLPAAAAAVALAVHRWVPSRQSTDQTGLYPRILLVIIGASFLLGITQ